MHDWQRLEHDPASLTAERLQLHYGVLVLASIAHSLHQPAEDDSHTNLGVEDGGALWSTHALRSAPLQRCALAAAALELQWLVGDEVAARLALPGCTLADALAWADRTAKTQLGGDAAVARREYPDFPASPIADGGRFDRGDSGARAELGRWFGNGLDLFEELSAQDQRLSPIRVWPHHFDLGALLPLRADDAEVMIGLGLSLGDDSYDEPYFYCSPFPEPAGQLPALGGPGHWHRQGFVSVVLTGSELFAAGGGQQAQARDYLRAAIDACRSLLG